MSINVFTEYSIQFRRLGMHFVKTDNIVERHIQNERLLVPVMNSVETLNSIYSLNETAASIVGKNGFRTKP